MKEIGRRVAVAPIGPARDIDAEDVVGRGQILITDLLGRLREFAYGDWIAPNGDIDKGQRECDEPRQCHGPRPADSSNRRPVKRTAWARLTAGLVGKLLGTTHLQRRYPWLM